MKTETYFTAICHKNFAQSSMTRRAEFAQDYLLVKMTVRCAKNMRGAYGMGLFVKKDLKLKLFVLITSVLLFTRDVGNIEINKYIFVVYITLFLLISDISSMCAMIAFVFPLLYGLPGNYIMPLALLLYLFKKRKLRVIQLGYLMFIVVMEILATRNYLSLQINQIVGYISIGALFFLIIYEEEIDYKRCLNYFVLGITLLCVVVIETISVSPSNWQTLLSSGYFRFGDVEDTNDGLRISLNANALSYLCITGISILLVLLQEKRKNVGHFIELSVLIISGALTVSRTFFAVAIVCVAFYIISVDKDHTSMLKRLGVLAAIILTAYLIFRFLPSLTDGVRARFERADVSTGNGRTELFLSYWDAFWERIIVVLLGTGVTQYQAVLGITYNALHNGILQLLVSYGLPGFFIFLYGWLKPVVTNIGRTKAIYYLPFICTFLYVQTAQFVNPYVLFCPHLFAVLTVCYGSNRRKEVKCES